ncbi:extracellular solute-binding protein [Gryllotalpicola reticulitermitis]|uniref:Extracellular solute-binding protein n=1 Tax=Gryllotalpicola reticulitermitis TaxID=1184153 RepID=A0ABV8Q0T1_9MICO
MYGDKLLDRRQVLRAGIAGAGALGVAGLLAACGASPSSISSGSAAQSGAILPKYVPYPTQVPTQFPGNSFGLVPFYKTYPANPKSVTKGTPGDGSAVSALTITYSPIVAGLGGNKFWQAVNKRLNIKLDMQQVGSADYLTKVPTVLAGNDLPDFLQFQTLQPSFPDLLKAKFQDLTPFLAGDKINDYPFLANIAQDFWSSEVVYNDGLYGIPIPAYKLVNHFFSRDDLIEAAGQNPKYTNWTEFVALCKAMTDTRHNRWALDHVVENAAAPAGTFGFALQCLGVGNVFEQKGGKFTSYHTDDRTKEAISACASLVKKGYVHPDAFSGSTVTWYTAMANGQAVLGMPGGLTTLPRFFNVNKDPNMKIGGSGPVPWDSSTTPHGWQRTPSFSMTAFKKASDDRIKMLLEVCNYLAAPFGSEEYRFLNYGVEGVDWTPTASGDPNVTQTGTAETLGFGLPYIAAPPRVLYYVGLGGPAETQYEIEKATMPTSIANPTLGLYSETYGRKWAQLELKMYDTQAQIMKGDAPISAWDDAVSSWKSNGGNQLLSEFNDAYAKSHK